MKRSYDSQKNVFEFTKGGLTYEIYLPSIKNYENEIQIPKRLEDGLEKIFDSLERKLRIKQLRDRLKLLPEDMEQDILAELYPLLDAEYIAERKYLYTDYYEDPYTKHITEYRVCESGDVQIIKTGQTMKELEEAYLDWLSD